MADGSHRWSDHFFEDPAHGASVERHIRDGVLPLRFAYAGSAAFTHDRLAWSEGYRSVIGPVELELRALSADRAAASCLPRVVEIGPGNGMHTLTLLRALAERGMHCRDYLGVDFSLTLLKLALKRIGEAMAGEPRLSWMGWDIESGLSGEIERWRRGLEGDGPVLAWMLGHTLGNVESGLDALENLHGSLRTGDTLVAGITLEPPSADYATILAPYRTDVFRAAALEPLHAAGISSHEIEFDVHFADGVVVGEAVFVRSVRIGQTTVHPGHVLRCFCSRRFAMEEVESMFGRTGWNVRGVMKDDQREHAVVLATRGKP